MRALLAVALLTAGLALPKERTVDVQYTVTIPTPPAGLQLWLPVPQSNEFQSIANLRFESPSPHQLATAPDGNRFFHTTLHAPATIHMRFRATRRERTLAPVPTPQPACCLHPDRLVPIDGRIAQWARQVAAGAQTNTGKARAVYNHVIETVKYDKSGKGWGRGDIYYACDARRGNCTDFHAIFIGYNRALGVPARFAIGLPLPPGKPAGEISGYHCWAEFWSPENGWVAIDASEAAKAPARRAYFFGAHDEHRIEFTRGRDLTLAPPQSGPPLNFSVYPYAEAAGQPFEDLQTRITFADVP